MVAGGLVLVAAGLTIVTQFQVDSSYGIVAAHLLVLGFGMGMAMAPATESVMGSLPLEKASVGSAVNDTTRTTGGALGVAILGSLLASQYRGDMDEAVSGLPHGAAESASDTLSGGLAVAHRHRRQRPRRRRPDGVRERHARRRPRRRRRGPRRRRSSPTR